MICYKHTFAERGQNMTPIELLQQEVIRHVMASNDADLLDLLLKILVESA